MGIGFEPVAKNRNLFWDRLNANHVPKVQLAEVKAGEALDPNRDANLDAVKSLRRMLHQRGATKKNMSGDDESSTSENVPGGFHLIGAALGDRTKAVRLRTRYDYSWGANYIPAVCQFFRQSSMITRNHDHHGFCRMMLRPRERTAVDPKWAFIMASKCS